MKKITLIAAATLLSACSTLSQPSISGIYKGILPCADCEKIEAVLVLNSDDTYEYNTVYFKRGEQSPFSEKGKFSRLPENPNIIRLEIVDEQPALTLKISENNAEFCDAEGNTVQGSHYVLSKIK